MKPLNSLGFYTHSTSKLPTSWQTKLYTTVTPLEPHVKETRRLDYAKAV